MKIFLQYPNTYKWWPKLDQDFNAESFIVFEFSYNYKVVKVWGIRRLEKGGIY